MKTHITPIPAEVRLTDLVTERLQVAGHAEPEAWQVGLDRVAYQTPDQNLQRFMINRRLRSLIGNFPTDTFETRTYLIDDGSLEDWVQCLEGKIIPCLLDHQAVH